ncbi:MULTISPECIES: GntR family transcriptional regulator [Streptomyces]|uniref:GntR family transcriptional regulator n=1 Tax=Streptomyces thermoviolaceus subsp. thermoviolaceus TaxID=66860 RepID=A0ABX0YXL0_STRTL|nr:GntR family transcriptional regulator [Streptomyces thermoviolaceus]NJP15811.1 GntR family transcriptional regulator [Streptomyces thermoviolaceus subsp. thermoviolaceus]WTD48491.1 GntR family transcriptional regulator [Streptomyces thermoviolaceus]GHA88819.1 GntR family transcriptional regulator [Streptomyces thermoviolaceus subsp. thermoviolaceus]
MSEIQRPGALYQQVAAAIREAILTGEFAPDSLLPSEAQLMARYGVSRPTVRNAIAALRAEGLIDVRHGKGSFVRSSRQPVLTVERRIGRTAEGKFVMPNGDVWQEAEEPSTYRTHTTKDTGRLLQLDEEEALFGCDRLLIDPNTGTRAMHRILIPFETAEAVPLLGKEPCKPPEAIYWVLTQAGHKLSWTETVRARMPLPDERIVLQLPDATPILHLARLTHGTGDRPLILEELRIGADRAELAYRITADKQPA